MRAAATSTVVVLLLVCIVARADVVHLNDGRSIEGDVKRTAEGWNVVVDGETTQFATEEVKSIEVGTSAAGPAKDGGLASLRRSLANVSDASQAVERYKRFIANNEKSAPAAVEMGKADLLVWQDRADRKLVKVGEKWLSRDDADAARAKAVAELSVARDLMLEGRTKDAKVMVDAALAADAQNATALYLRGVQAYAEGDVPVARRSFDATVNAMAEAHGPTLNNLAVVMMRQNQSPAALVTYAKALQAPPADARVLDNVAEALNASGNDAKLANAVKKLAAVFQPIDVAVAAQMAKRGMYRWGASWIPQADMERLQAEEKLAKEKIEKAEVEFATVQGDIRLMDDLSADNERSMRRMEANSIIRDATTGRVIRTELPRSYYELQRDNQELQVSRQRATARIDQLKSDAKKLRDTMPKPRYSGVQKMLGPEAAPGLPPPPPPAPIAVRGLPDVTPAAVAPTSRPATMPLLPMSPLLPK